MASGSGGSDGLEFERGILEAWEKCAKEEGLFRTDYSKTMRKVVGDGLLAQFNPEHIAKKRPTTISAPKDAPTLPVSRPFNADGFHFLKAARKETVLRFSDGCKTWESGPWADEDDAKGLVHVGMVNVSPLLSPHCLVMPWMRECRPQVLTADAIGVAFDLVRKAPTLRVGFNSLAAWASVNHLHLHVLGISDTGKATLPIEDIIHAHLASPTTTTICTNAHAKVWDLDSVWPLGGVVVREESGETAAKLIKYLQSNTIPHNVLWTSYDATHVQTVIFPRTQQRILGGGEVNIAIVEACGLAIVNTSKEDFDALSPRTFHSLLASHHLAPASYASLIKEIQSDTF